MIPARFLAEAMEELREAALFYEERQLGLGDRFLTEVHEAVRKIQAFPETWIHISKASRRCRVAGFPYGLIYQVVSDEILILAVMHLARRPGYWQERER